MLQQWIGTGCSKKQTRNLGSQEYVQNLPTLTVLPSTTGKNPYTVIHLLYFNEDRHGEWFDKLIISQLLLLDILLIFHHSLNAWLRSFFKYS